MYQTDDEIVKPINAGSHHCDLSKYPFGTYTRPIVYCIDLDNGSLWVGNSMCWMQVNYCPACGLEAKVKVKAEV